MLRNQKMLHVLISLSLLLGLATRPAVAVQTPESDPIKQPLTSQIYVTLGGFALVGLFIAMENYCR